MYLPANCGCHPVAPRAVGQHHPAACAFRLALQTFQSVSYVALPLVRRKGCLILGGRSGLPSRNISPPSSSVSPIFSMRKLCRDGYNAGTPAKITLNFISPQIHHLPHARIKTLYSLPAVSLLARRSNSRWWCNSSGVVAISTSV